MTAVHGPHQVAQKSITTTLPRYDESECVWPSGPVNCQSGAVVPTSSSFIACFCECFGGGPIMIGPCAMSTLSEPHKVTRIKPQMKRLMFITLETTRVTDQNHVIGKSCVASTTAAQDV